MLIAGASRLRTLKLCGSLGNSIFLGRTLAWLGRPLARWGARWGLGRLVLPAPVCGVGEVVSESAAAGLMPGGKGGGAVSQGAGQQSLVPWGREANETVRIICLSWAGMGGVMTPKFRVKIHIPRKTSPPALAGEERDAGGVAGMLAAWWGRAVRKRTLPREPGLSLLARPSGPGPLSRRPGLGALTRPPGPGPLPHLLPQGPSVASGLISNSY